MSLSINNHRKKKVHVRWAIEKEGVESRECEFACVLRDSGKLLGNSVKPYTIRTALNT